MRDQLKDGGFNVPLTNRMKMNDASLIDELTNILSRGFQLLDDRPTDGRRNSEHRDVEEILSVLRYRHVVEVTKVVSPPIKEEFAEMRVCEYLMEAGLDMADLEEKQDESSYWLSCTSFVDDNFEEKLKNLSHKQRQWLTKIKMDLLA